MLWREVRAAAGDGVPLDARLSGRRFCGDIEEAATGAECCLDKR
jgi:hypothetical protein